MLLPIIFLISVTSFLLIVYSPGDTARLVLSQRLNTTHISDEYVREFAERKGLNRSALSLYGDWLSGLASGNLGNSLLAGEPVTEMLKNAMSKTLLLALLAFSTMVLLSFPLGFAAALKTDGVWDKISEYWSLLSTSTPTYWIAQVVLWLCAAKLKWTFVIGYHGAISLLVPGFLMGLMSVGSLSRVIRSKTLLTLKEVYVEQAMAQGLPLRRVLFGHVLKNALPPTLSILSGSLTGLISGAVLVEKIFSIPGIGLLTLSAMDSKDIILLAGIVFYLATFICIINFISDLICISLDRRGTSEIYR